MSHDLMLKRLAANTMQYPSKQAVGEFLSTVWAAPRETVPAERDLKNLW